MANLWLSGVDQLHGQRIVGVGKHVCGAATDLALRCLVPAQPNAVPGSEVGTAGIAIALCCYHVCSWEAYCNQEWVCQQGMDAGDFAQIVRMASWCHIDPFNEAARAKTRCDAFLGRICSHSAGVCLSPSRSRSLSQDCPSMQAIYRRRASLVFVPTRV